MCQTRTERFTGSAWLPSALSARARLPARYHAGSPDLYLATKTFHYPFASKASKVRLVVGTRQVPGGKFGHRGVLGDAKPASFVSRQEVGRQLLRGEISSEHSRSVKAQSSRTPEKTLGAEKPSASGPQPSEVRRAMCLAIMEVSATDHFRDHRELLG